jgi:hypothetical protein
MGDKVKPNGKKGMNLRATAHPHDSRSGGPRWPPEARQSR